VDSRAVLALCFGVGVARSLAEFYKSSSLCSGQIVASHDDVT